MKLYYSAGACSLAPHVAGRELSLDIEFVAVPIAIGSNMRAEYLALSRRGRVLALSVGEQLFTEAPAILVYLASQKPENALLPAHGSTDLSRCLEWLGWFTSSLHIGYARFWGPERFLSPDEDSAGFVANARAQIEQMNDEVETRLSGSWFIPSGYTIADICALPLYRWGNRVGLPMKERWPRWHEWSQRMLARPAVREAITHEGIGFGSFGQADDSLNQRAMIAI